MRNNPFAQFIDAENDPIVEPAMTPQQVGAERRAERSLGIQEGNAASNQQLTELKIGEARDEAEERAKEKQQAAKAEDAARWKLIKVIGELSSVALDADDNGGWGETGNSGAFMRALPVKGTAGFDLQKNIGTVDAEFAFGALQAMRDASKTGGALGAITEKELELLKSSVQAIDPNMGHETFLGNVEKARQAYLAKLAMLDPDTAARLGYDGRKAEAAFLELNDAYNKKFGTAESLPISNEQTTPIVSPTPVPADIEAIMAKYGTR